MADNYDDKDGLVSMFNDKMYKLYKKRILVCY